MMGRFSFNITAARWLQVAAGVAAGCRLSSARCSGDAVVEVAELPAAGGHMVTLDTQLARTRSAVPSPHHTTAHCQGRGHSPASTINIYPPLTHPCPTYPPLAR